MKAIKQYFHVVLVLTFKSVDKTLVCDHLNKSYMCWAVLSFGPNFVVVVVVDIFKHEFEYFNFEKFNRFSTEWRVVHSHNFCQ